MHRIVTGIVAIAAIFGLAVTAASASPGAGVSIVGGTPTTIDKWPWQVALAKSTTATPKDSGRKRQFCGGSILAPTLVLTAAHCAVEIETGELEDFSIIAGRTDLNDSASGSEVPVLNVHFPLTRNGFPRFLLQFGWDIALVELGEPLSQRAAKILGPDEQGILKPGRRLVETGWGTISDRRPVRPGTLMLGRTNIQPAALCADEVGPFFETGTQICLGDARGVQGNCYGDSGGPALVATSAGYRLVGATSYGTSSRCGRTTTNVDAFVAGKVMRAWIREKVLAMTGIDPVGGGGTAEPVAGLCRVPKLYNLRLAVAKNRLRRAGCSRFQVKRIDLSRWRAGKRFRGVVLGSPVPVGWLWDAAAPIKLDVGAWHERAEKPKR